MSRCGNSLCRLLKAGEAKRSSRAGPRKATRQHGSGHQLLTSCIALLLQKTGDTTLDISGTCWALIQEDLSFPGYQRGLPICHPSGYNPPVVISWSDPWLTVAMFVATATEGRTPGRFNSSSSPCLPILYEAVSSLGTFSPLHISNSQGAEMLFLNKLNGNACFIVLPASKRQR